VRYVADIQTDISKQNTSAGEMYSAISVIGW